MHDETVAFLRSLRIAQIERRQKEQRLDRLMAEAERVTSKLSFTGGGGDKRGDALLAEIADRSREVEEAIRACLERESLVEVFISSLGDARHRAVLYQRYVLGASWDAVRDELAEIGLQYEMRNVYRLHGAALQAAREQYPKFVELHPVLRDKM